MANIATELELPADYDDASARLFHLNPPLQLHSRTASGDELVGWTSYVVVWAVGFPDSDIRRPGVVRIIPTNRDAVMDQVWDWTTVHDTTDTTYALATLDYRIEAAL